MVEIRINNSNLLRIKLREYNKIVNKKNKNNREISMNRLKNLVKVNLRRMHSQSILILSSISKIKNNYKQLNEIYLMRMKKHNNNNNLKNLKYTLSHHRAFNY